MNSPILWGSDFLVNTTLLDRQDYPAAAGLPDGRFVIVWMDYSATGLDTSAAAVRAQLFNADGSKYGTEFLVNTTTEGWQSGPDVVSLSDGRFVVTWTDGSGSLGAGSQEDVRAQIFNADGSRFGAQFLVNTTISKAQYNGEVTALSDGRFVATWVDFSETGGDTTDRAVRAQIFSSDGTKSGEEFLANTNTLGGQDMPAITALSNGGFVISWANPVQSGGETSDWELVGQVFSSNGVRLGSEFPINTTHTGDQFEVQLAALAGGGFVAVWGNYAASGGIGQTNQCRAQVFSSVGEKVGGEIMVYAASLGNSHQPTIAALSDGRFAVVYSSESITSLDREIRVQVYNQDGTETGSALVVNTTLTASLSQPSIAALPDGRLLVTWNRYDLSDPQNIVNNVYAQIVDASVQVTYLQGSNGADTISGTIGDNNILGFGGNDKLSGLSGNDYLDGGAGNDSMYGGLGDDVYVVDSSRDLVSEKNNEGTDEVLTALASYTLGANVENLTYTGTGNFTGKGNAAANVLTGGVGNDSLDGSTGADTLVGGGGNDTYTIDNVDDVVTELPGGGTDTVLSSVAVTALAANVENLTLSGSAAINATGNELGNRITGNSGANVLDGGAGADTLTGGSGNDTYVVDAADTVVEAANGGIDSVRALFSYMLGNNLENLILVGSTAMNGTGNTLGNALTGNVANNALDGGAGNDTLDGGGGVDTLTGGAGNDIFVTDGGDVIVEASGGGTDTVQTSVTSTLGTNVENLTLTGAGAVNGTGNSLNNVMTGNAAANVLNGGTGADTLVGGLGNDTYVTDGGDTITEASNGGTDLIQSSANHTLAANVENLTLTGTAVLTGTGNTLNNLITGNSGANLLDGGSGNDSLIGGEGADSLVGGVGTDQLTGGSGADAFVFKTATESSNVLATADVITEFVQGQDRIDLSAIDASSSLTGNNAFVWLGTAAIGTAASGDLRYQKYDNAGTDNDYTLVITDTDSDTASEFMIKLVGLYDLTANDFLL